MYNWPQNKTEQIRREFHWITTFQKYVIYMLLILIPISAIISLVLVNFVIEVVILETDWNCENETLHDWFFDI